MTKEQIYNKYIKLVPKIRSSNTSLRSLASELNMSVNTLQRIKEAIVYVENQVKTKRKTIRFTESELITIEEKANELGLDIASFIRFCINEYIS